MRISNQNLENKRKEEYFQAQAEAFERKKKLEEAEKLEFLKKKQQEIENERLRKAVKEKFDALLQEKQQSLLRKIEKNAEKAEKSQFSRTLEARERHNADVLKRFVKKDQVQRLLLKQEWEKSKIMQKISENSEKTAEIKRQRLAILDTRKRIREEIAVNKKDIMEKFAKIKAGRVNYRVF